MSETRRPTELTIHPRADVVPLPDPETHEQMAADVERRGIVVPLDILADGTVLDGRTRLSIARVLGLAEVPVRVVDAPDPFDYMVRAAESFFAAVAEGTEPAGSPSRIVADWFRRRPVQATRTGDRREPIEVIVRGFNAWRSGKALAFPKTPGFTLSRVK